MIYRDRRDAGRRLAEHLQDYDNTNAIVCALPRGGVPVAAEVASILHLELRLLFVRKLGVPWQPEVAFGAIGEDDICVINSRLVADLGLSAERIAAVRSAAQAQLTRAQAIFGTTAASTSTLPDTVILVDDGIATGATVEAAIAVLRARDVEHIVVAAPVAAEDSVRRLRLTADEVVVPLVPQDFQAVGQYYRDFRQLSDDEVRAILGGG